MTPVGAAQNYQTSHPTLRARSSTGRRWRKPSAVNANGELFTRGGESLQVEGQLPGHAGDPDRSTARAAGTPSARPRRNALLGFIATLQATDPDVLVIGDLNAYGAEDPIKTLEAGGLVNEANRVPAASRYSYVFDGQAGIWIRPWRHPPGSAGGRA